MVTSTNNERAPCLKRDGRHWSHSRCRSPEQIAKLLMKNENKYEGRDKNEKLSLRKVARCFDRSITLQTIYVVLYSSVRYLTTNFRDHSISWYWKPVRRYRGPPVHPVQNKAWKNIVYWPYKKSLTTSKRFKVANRRI